MRQSDTFFRRIPGFIRKDFLRKFISVLLALMLCYFVRSNQATETLSFDIPVKIEQPDSQTVVLSKQENLHATIQVKCSRYRQKTLSPEDFSLTVRQGIANYRKGQKMEVPLNKWNVNAPWGVSVLRISPAKIQVLYSRLESKEIPVKPYFFPKTPAKDYAYLGSVVKPQKIKVTAPDILLEKLQLTTVPISLAGRKSSFKFTAEIDQSKLPELAQLETPSAEVSVEIGVEKTNREFPNIQVHLMSSGGNRFKVEFLSSPLVNLVISGPRKALDDLKHADIKPFADLCSIRKSGVYSLKVECFLPGELYVKEFKPSEVKVEVK